LSRITQFQGVSWFDVVHSTIWNTCLRVAPRESNMLNKGTCILRETTVLLLPLVLTLTLS